MKVIRTLAIMLYLLPGNIAWSQNLDIKQFMEQQKQSFNKHQVQQKESFEQYRSHLNTEYAKYIRQAWPEYEAKSAEQVPNRPEPPAPLVKRPDIAPTSDTIPYKYIMPAPIPDTIIPPLPIAPSPESEPQNSKPNKSVQHDPLQHTFTFYGTPCNVHLTDAHRFRLSGTDENSVANVWVQLSSNKYNPVISDCLEWRGKLHLPDWGYLRFVEKMTESFLGNTSHNEAKLMQWYILTQSGYRVRIARAGNDLVLLLPSKSNIYQYPFININNTRFFIIDKSANHSSYHVFDKEFPKEQYFSLQINGNPMLSIKNAEPRILTSERYPEASATVTPNGNLIDFYNDYPITDDWNIYVKASLCEDIKNQMFPALKKAIEDKGKPEAANILLNFVQTAFEYKTDDAQFGYERPLFGDETLYYPYCDCEDRAILFSVLVRELLGLETVMLEYPNHLATAICFDSDVPGDYLVVDGKRYTICDPTYINAEIGQSMPQLKRTDAKVTKLTSPVFHQ